MKELAMKILFLCSVGMILSAAGEMFFYEVTIDWGFYWLLLLYGVYGGAAVILIEHYKIKNFGSMFLAASVFGFLIEGALLGVLYESLPFSIVWTSLAWHVMISWVLFFYYFRKKLLYSSCFHNIIYSIFLGILLGLWGTYSWNAGSMDGENVIFEWRHTGIYASQIVLGYVIFLFGHILYEKTFSSLSCFSKGEKKILFGIILFSFCIGNAIIYFPFSLILVPLLYLCYKALEKGNHTGKENILLGEKIQASRYLLSLIVPVIASIVYYICYAYRVEIEMNALYFLIFGSISLYLFSKCVYKNLINFDKN